MNTLAQRVMAIILVRCFQRFRSFVKFAVEDIICGERPVEVLIVHSKNGRIMQRIPLEPLCTVSEVQFVRDFRKYLGELDIGQETPLTELAGLGRLSGRGTNARRKFKKALGRFCSNPSAYTTLVGLGLSISRLMILAHHPEVTNVYRGASRVSNILR